MGPLEPTCTLGKHAASVFGASPAKGGFATVARSCWPGSLCLVDREQISRGLVIGRTLWLLRRDMKRAALTISREVAGNGEPPTAQTKCLVGRTDRNCPLSGVCSKDRLPS